MWETQLQFTNSDYALDCERKEVLLEHVKLLYNNLRPEAVMEMPATQKQSKSERWFCEHWCRLTVSRCPGVPVLSKLGSLLVSASQMLPLKQISLSPTRSEHFQT